VGANGAQADTAGVLAIPPVKAVNSRSLTSYLHDVSPVIPSITDQSVITEQYRVPAPDGTLLDTWVVRPDLPGKRPIVLQFTPYYGGGTPQTPIMSLFDSSFQELLHRGYAIAISSIRGTGNSGGCFTIGGKSEAKDHAAVIEKLAAQPWSNGNVGLMGVSYPGTAPMDAWVEAPPHLKTIVPVEGITDLYKYNFVNGVPISNIGFHAYYWVLVGLGPAGLNFGTQAADPVSIPGAMTGEVCQERIPITEEAASSAIDGNKDVYWQERDFLRELKASPNKKRASMLYIQGFNDWNVKTSDAEGWLPAVQATGVPFKALMGQTAHEYPTRMDWLDFMTAWYDQFLWERNTGVLDAPKVQLQDDTGAWRGESQWPPAVDKLTLHPTSTGELGTATGTGVATFEDFTGQRVVPEAPVPGDRVVFTSAPLSADLHLSGMPRFTGAVTATGDRANLMLSLGDQAPDGTITYTNWACLSLNHAANLEHGIASVAGLRQTVGVNFFPQEDVIKAGHRLVLVAAGNLLQAATNDVDEAALNTGFTMRPIASGSTMTIDLATARLILPHDISLRHESATPVPQPNLRTTRLVVRKTQSGAVIVTARIVNVGAVPAKGVTVALRDGTKTLRRVSPFNLAPGSFRTVSWWLRGNGLAPGSHQLSVVADPMDVIPEDYENDNAAWARVRISG